MKYRDRFVNLSNIKIKGIKGYSWFGQLMNIPEQFFLDIMHVSFHGTLERILTMWFKEFKNEKKQINKFYLNPVKKRLLDQMALKIQYPNEIKRNQREITENLKDLKANDFRNIIFYLVPLFKT